MEQIDGENDNNSENEITYVSHSLIPCYPVDVIKFPQYYNSICKTYVLREGDMLYIPPQYSHWVFSYGDNLALTFPVTDFKGYIDSPFDLENPLQFKLVDLPFLKWNLKYLLDATGEDDKFQCLLSKGQSLYPVKKPHHKRQIYRKNLTKKDILDTIKEKKLNISIGQNANMISGVYKEAKPPHFWLKSFNGSKIVARTWVSSSKNDAPIDTGLHYDLGYSSLVQITGVKVVKLFSPDQLSNLYMSPLCGV